MNTHQILVTGATENEIVDLFNNTNGLLSLNWTKAYKDMFVVNFDSEQTKSYRRTPYFLYQIEDMLSLEMREKGRQAREDFRKAFFENAENVFGDVYQYNEEYYHVVPITNQRLRDRPIHKINDDTLESLRERHDYYAEIARDMIAVEKKTGRTIKLRF